MRLSTVLSLTVISVLGLFLWATGCSDLSEDCELNLNCASVQQADCSKPVFLGACDDCLHAQCCPEVADCVKNETCLDYCVNNLLPSPPECTEIDGSLKQTFGALTQCMNTKCADKCPPADRCNPVTNNGCAMDDWCDIAYPGSFACFSSSNTLATLCQACDLNVGPLCAAGMRCHPTAKKCAKYCCTDADCGTGRCELDQMTVFGVELPMTNAVGLCMDDADPMVVTPACDAPATPMSDGSCFTGYAGM